MDYLTKYLKKLGVTDRSELYEEEKGTYDKWHRALSGRRLTDEDVKTDLQRMKEVYVGEWAGNPDMSDKRSNFLRANVNLLMKIEQILQAPQVEKETMEKTINNLIEQ